MPHPAKPIVLSIAGHDPSGGAGIQADIETLTALGCHPATCISSLTLQDSHNVYQLRPLQADWIGQQLEILFQDYPVACIKIGLLGSAETATMLADLLRRKPHIPLVIDPILAAGGGTALATDLLIETLLGQLFPLATVITPNAPEARRLAGKQTLDACAERLLETGCGAVLITGTHEESSGVVNRLYRPNAPVTSQSWPRLAHSYHGSGCTLASAIAAGLARGMPLEEAVSRAQTYTWDSLSAGWRPGKGQHLPDRSHRNSVE
ncbi:MAG: hydroxymethylpyrimidine/phosphomethylpyrimidine kinase [Sedimenticola sp.]|nr:hydroxymethylpyrimidine/phosphomethylpyrimidine kinase [Sedimenticola sp.]